MANEKVEFHRLYEWLIHEITQKGRFDAYEGFEVVFPGRLFSKQVLKDVMSQLFSCLKEYLAEEEMDRTPVLPEILAIRALRQNNLTKVVKTEIRALRKKISKQPPEVGELLHEQFLLARESTLLAGNVRHSVHEDGPLSANSLIGQIELDYLDLYYFTEKLRLGCELINRGTILKEQYELRLLPELVAYLMEHPALTEPYPVLKLYLKIYLLLTQPEEGSHFFELVGLLEVHQSQLGGAEVKGLYKYAQNHCIRRVNLGEMKYLGELSRLYEAQLQNGRLFSNGELAHTSYLNIVTTGLRLRRYGWVSEFIHTYREKVPADYRESVYAYCMAAFHYEQQAYQQAARLLQEVTFVDVFYQISARLLLCKIYFEKEDDEALFYAADAFGRYLKRNKELSPQNRVHYLNFLSCLKSLTKLREQFYRIKAEPYTARWEKVAVRLKSMEKVSNLAWLQERLQNLKGTS